MTTEVDKIWAGDLLNRKEDAQILFDFLVRRHRERREGGVKGAYVVNLNAGWGHGKSFFMERLKLQMEAAGHLTAFVNAWRDDSSKEPVVAVMAAIEESLKPHFATKTALRKTWDSAKAHSATIVASLAKGASRKLVEKFTGGAMNEIGELIEENDRVSDNIESALAEHDGAVSTAVASEITTLLTKLVDDKITNYQSRIESSAQFQNRMRQLLVDIEGKDGIALPFFVLIDELDRCRPTYAIEMLEQVKHMFDIDNTVFLIATDGDQLAHSVSAVYGEKFDGKRYLLRFFHRHYRFEQRDLKAFTDYLFAANQIDVDKLTTPWNEPPTNIFVGAMNKYGVTLRDAEQCFDILRSAVTMWPHQVPIHLNLILPLIIHFQRHELEEMKAFISNQQGPPDGPSEWSIMATLPRDRFHSEKKLLTIEALNYAVLGRLTTPLPTIMENQGSDTETKYARGLFQAEFAAIHNNSFQHPGPLSVINEYPALVRSVGRLAAPADDPDVLTV